MTPLLKLSGIEKRYDLEREGLFSRVSRQLHAVDGVDFEIANGEAVGLVGESGSGKSTLLRIASRLIDHTAGSIVFDGNDIGSTSARRFSKAVLRRDIQVVFQDAGESLAPHFTAFQSIAEPLRMMEGLRDQKAIESRVFEAAQMVGLGTQPLASLPHRLSGGQKARIAIARAIVTRPRLLLLDEPTSALDVSVQATILQLLDRLRRDLGLSYVFVSHDLNVVRLICDRVMVMYLGQIVEMGSSAQIFDSPTHPYTRALVGAISRLERRKEPAERIRGEPQSPIDPDPARCRFAGRCPRQLSVCTTTAPKLKPVAHGHEVACFVAMSNTANAQETDQHELL